MQYIVGYINHDGLPLVQLQKLDKEGNPTDEVIESPAFETNGVLTTDDHGRVVLQEKSKPKETGATGE